MADTIKVYGPKTKEHKRLEAAVMLINAEFGDSYGNAEVRDVFWDYGGGLQWTTICFGDEYQALEPLTHAKITIGNMTDFSQAVNYVMQRRREHIKLIEALRNGVKTNEQ